MKALTITIDYLEFALPADTTRADVDKLVALLAQMKKVESNYLGEHRAEGEPSSIYYAQDEYASIRLNDRRLDPQVGQRHHRPEAHGAERHDHRERCRHQRPQRDRRFLARDVDGEDEQDGDEAGADTQLDDRHLRRAESEHQDGRERRGACQPQGRDEQARAADGFERTRQHRCHDQQVEHGRIP